MPSGAGRRFIVVGTAQAPEQRRKRNQRPLWFGLFRGRYRSVLVLMTYLISIGNFAHMIAGSMEAFMLVVNRDAELWRIVQGFLVPVLIL
jgi:hypothetical protein